MIRFIYWVLVLVEVLLIVAVLLLFIVTDSRTIKFAAKYGMESSKFTYSSIEGNLLEGLKIEDFAYQNEKLFDKATVHWNPLSLIYKKITITKIDVQGVELKNIMTMAKALKSSSDSNETLALDYSLSLDRIHVDINPYVFEGVKFSSFLFNVDDVFIDKDLLIDANNMNLSFNSDLTNVKLQGNIEESKLLLDEVSLKEISSVAITKLVRRLKKLNPEKSAKIVENKTEKVAFVPFKKIEIKHILGTLKHVKYGTLDLKKATLNIYKARINPYDNYNYNAKKVTFKGKTNVGDLDFKGDIKNSMIDSEGEVLLSKYLFSNYALPLNYHALKKLPSKLKLNHQGVWVEVNHKVQNLLANTHDFNIDITKGKHKIAYLYGKDLLVESALEGSNTYADEMKIDANTTVSFKNKEVLYVGEVKASKFKKIVPEISNYLFDNLQAKYQGKDKALLVNFESNLVHGVFETKGYTNATLKVESKDENIELKRLVKKLDAKFKNEKLAFKSKTFLDFKNRKNSNTTLDISSNLINIESSGKFSLPTKIRSTFSIPQQSQLRQIDNKFNFNRLEALDVELVLNENIYNIHINDRRNSMRMALIYNVETQELEEGKLYLGSEEIKIKNASQNAFSLHSNIHNIQSFLKQIKPYYAIDIPNIQGAMELDILKENSKSMIKINSTHIKYLSDAGSELKIFNIRDIEFYFSLDDSSNIELFNYKFKIDSNPYLDHFYATKHSLLSFKNGLITIQKLWINDNVLLKGTYDTQNLKGSFDLNSDSYAFNNDELTLLFGLDLSLKTDKSKIDIEGDIDILGGTINYEIESSGLVEDSDIIVLQEMMKEKESAFNDIKLYLKIHNKKPLRYYGKDAQIDFYNELSVVKSFNQEMMITGMSTITNGFYELEDKRFILDESHLYFAGDVKKPLLDIKANYHKDQYTVHIFISGTTDEPIVNFNSDPYLKQQEILSLILFDGTGSSDGTGAEAYTLLGGTFAKGLMKSIGINIDHLLLGTDENNQLSLEIGKKISDNISLMYLSKDGLNGAKVKVEHSRSFETDIIIMPPNTSSIEFLYKRDH